MKYGYPPEISMIVFTDLSSKVTGDLADLIGVRMASRLALSFSLSRKTTWNILSEKVLASTSFGYKVGRPVNRSIKGIPLRCIDWKTSKSKDSGYWAFAG